MKLDKKLITPLVILVLFLIFFFLIVTNFYADSDINRNFYRQTDENDIIYFPHSGPVSVAKKIVDSGALPEIPDSLGGKGFEKYALKNGWLDGLDIKHRGSFFAVKGGTFSFANPQAIETCRAYGENVYTQLNAAINNLLYEPLIKIDEVTGNIIPALASHWKKVDEHTLYLRIDPESRWCDGSRVLARDVLSTFEFIVNNNIIFDYDIKVFKNWNIDLISEYIVKLSAKDKNLYNNFKYLTAIYVLPSAVIEGITYDEYKIKFNHRLILNSGPYLIDNQTTDWKNKIVFRRRSDYWGVNKYHNTGLNNFDRIEYYFYDNDDIIKEKFKNREIDFYQIKNTSEWNGEFNPQSSGYSISDKIQRGLILLKEIDNLAAKTLNVFPLNLAKKKLRDKNVRKALAYLLDRKTLIEKYWSGEFEPTSSFFESTVYQNDNNTIYDFNPHLADSLLDESDYRFRDSDNMRINKKGERLTIEAIAGKDAENIFLSYKEDLKKNGIVLNFQALNWSKVFNNLEKGNYEMSKVGYHIDDIKLISTILYTPESDLEISGNITRYSNARIDSLISLLLDNKSVEYDKIKYAREIDNILCDDVPYILLVNKNYTDRVAFWNKFGYPESVYSAKGTNFTILNLWWYDDQISTSLEKNLDDKFFTMNKGQIKVSFKGD